MEPLRELHGLMTHYLEVEALKEAAAKIVSAHNEKLDSLEGRILATLKAAKLKSARLEGLGTVTCRERTAVRVPKSMEEKKKFFEYLAEKGEEVFLGTVTVNYQTLNGFYKDEMEAAEKNGVFPFIVPGIEEPITTESMAFTKEKQSGKSKNSGSNASPSGNTIQDTF